MIFVGLAGQQAPSGVRLPHAHRHASHAPNASLKQQAADRSAQIIQARVRQRRTRAAPEQHHWRRTTSRRWPTPSTTAAQPPARCTVKASSATPDDGDDDVEEREARAGH